uniref:SWIM-type domain-containing protein n=2 Tax=Oryza barthii TaxID=65489 RepID=A0A0D3GNT6_9ORYZ
MIPMQMQMARWDEILTLPVQNPPTPEFSASDIMWSRVEGWKDSMDRLALIPFSRVNDFVRGESNNKECPTRFHVEARRRRPPTMNCKPKVDGILEYILYWCSFGPDDYRKGGSVRPSRNSSTKRKTPAGRPHTKRGCICHFIVKRLIAEPSVALVIYNHDKHVDKIGKPCHGPMDNMAIGTKAMFAPYISDELRLQIMSLLCVGIPVETIMQRHTEMIEKQGGPSNRDGLLTHRYVRRLERKIRRSVYELDDDDAISINIWVENHQNHIFLYEDFSDKDTFIVGVQTDWQLQQMIQYGNRSLLASDSKFGTNKLKYPVHSLLVFDEQKNAIPVAWIITPNFSHGEAYRWMGALYDRVRTKDPTWQLGGFIIDDPFADVRTIRGNGGMELFEAFLEDFVDCAGFLDYFRALWFPRLGSWITMLRTTPLATTEVASAIESYHHLLKLRLLNEANERVYQRADWLVHKLGTKVHSYYWLDEYSGKDNFSRYWRSEWKSGPNPWQQGLQIPDSDVIVEGNCARVVCQKNKERSHVIVNPGSDLALCDCSWSRKGNICKHAIKSTKVFRQRGLAPPSLALYRYYQALANVVHCPPSDTLISDHAVAVAIFVRTQLDSLLDATNGNSSNRSTSKDPQSVIEPRESDVREGSIENDVCASQSQAECGDEVSDEQNDDLDRFVFKKRKSREASDEEGSPTATQITQPSETESSQATDLQEPLDRQENRAPKKSKSKEASDGGKANARQAKQPSETESRPAIDQQEPLHHRQENPAHKKTKSGEASDGEETMAMQVMEPSETE